jgi:hypothetical protein
MQALSDDMLSANNMVSKKKHYRANSVMEVEKLKQALRQNLWAQPVKHAQRISSSVGSGRGMRLVISRPLH